MGTIDPTIVSSSEYNSAQNYVLPYFRNSVEKGVERSGLKKEIILSQDEFAVFALNEYLAHMLAYFVTPKKVSKQKGSRFRDEYFFELFQEAQDNEFPSTRIFIYEHAGKLALFTATIIPKSLDRTLLKPEDYIKFANVAYCNVVSEQQRFTGDTAPVYMLLAQRTNQIAEVLVEVAEVDIRIGGKLLGRPFVTLEQIITNNESYDIIAEAEKILKNCT